PCRPHQPGYGHAICHECSVRHAACWVGHALSQRVIGVEHMTTKTGSAVWKGGFKDGSGTISTETGALNNAPYGVASRFESGQGTNPEELIGAAHASCFSMAFSLMLGEAGFTPDEIRTSAKITLDKVADGFAVTSSHLTVEARI